MCGRAAFPASKPVCALAPRCAFLSLFCSRRVVISLVQIRSSCLQICIGKGPCCSGDRTPCRLPAAASLRLSMPVGGAEKCIGWPILHLHRVLPRPNSWHIWRVSLHLAAVCLALLPCLCLHRRLSGNTCCTIAPSQTLHRAYSPSQGGDSHAAPFPLGCPVGPRPRRRLALPAATVVVRPPRCGEAAARRQTL